MRESLVNSQWCLIRTTHNFPFLSWIINKQLRLLQKPLYVVYSHSISVVGNTDKIQRTHEKYQDCSSQNNRTSKLESRARFKKPTLLDSTSSSHVERPRVCCRLVTLSWYRYPNNFLNIELYATLSFLRSPLCYFEKQPFSSYEAKIGFIEMY